MAEFGAEIRSRGAVRGAGEMTDAAPIALASGEVAVGRQKWVRRSLWLAGGVGVVSLLAAGYWEELKELNAYGQLYLRAPPPHESVRVRTGESDASTSSHPPSGAPPGRRARALASAKRADRRGRPRRCRFVRALRACADAREGRLGGVAAPEPSTGRRRRTERRDVHL